MSQPNSNDDAMFGDIESQIDDGMQPMDGAYEPAMQYRKPTFTIYSMMLLLSFLFATTAAVILFMNVKP